MRRFYLFIMVLFTPWLIFAQTSGSHLQLTENDVIELALQQNLDLKQVQQKIVRYQAIAKEMNAQKWAALDFQSGYTHLSEVMEITFPTTSLAGLPFNIPTQKIRFGDGNTYEFALGLAQPLFTGGTLLNTARAAQQEVLALKWQQQANRNQIVFEAKKAFYHLIKAREMRKVAQTSIEQIKAHLKDVTNFYQQGQVTRNEVLTVEVKLSEAELLLTQANKAIELARIGLLMLLNQDLELAVTPEYDVQQWDTTFNRAVESFQPEDKAEVGILKHQLASLNFRRQAAKGTYWPSLGVFSRYVYGKPGLDQIANEWMDYWVVGVNLKWNLWDWGKRSARVQQLQSAADELELGLEQLKSRLNADLQRTRLNLKEAGQQLKIVHKMLTRAEENFRIVENRYLQGLIPNSEYLDAQADLTRSRLQKVQHLIDFQLALADYRRALTTDTN